MFEFLSFAALGCLIRAESKRIDEDYLSAKLWFSLAAVEIVILIIWHHIAPTAYLEPGLPNPILAAVYFLLDALCAFLNWLFRFLLS